MLALACGVALAAGPLAQVAPAQGKSKETKKEADTGSYRFVSGDETLTSGDQVSIKRKNMDKVTGVFVYADPKSNTLYVRPKSGQPPIAVPASEIDKVERIRPAGTTGGKEGVRPAIDAGEKGAPSYEIHTMTIHDGPSVRTFYYSTSLSPGEAEQLQAMERAGADVLRKRAMVDSLGAAIQDAATAPPATAVVETAGPGFGYPAYMAPYAYYGYNLTFNWPLFNAPGYGFGLPSFGYATFAPAYYGYGGGSNSTVVVQNGGGSTGQSVAALTKALGEAEAALADAQKNYVAVSQRAIYDGNGRIVAVRFEK
jgi:hypothetical protein